MYQDDQITNPASATANPATTSPPERVGGALASVLLETGVSVGVSLHDDESGEVASLSMALAWSRGRVPDNCLICIVGSQICSNSGLCNTSIKWS